MTNQIQAIKLAESNESKPACSRSCDGCVHAYKHWKESSQLPTCNHPEVYRNNKYITEFGGIWQLHTTTETGHCGPSRKNFSTDPKDLRIMEINKILAKNVKVKYNLGALGL